MLQKTRAIILSSIKYGDSSLIVHAYTGEWGRTSLLLKGIRKSRRGNRSAIFQPFYLLELDVYYRENREMHWIRDASFVQNRQAKALDFTKAAQAMFLSEVLVKTIGEEEKNQELFHFLEQSVSWFHTVPQAAPSFHLLFMFMLSRYLGFYPRNNFSSENTYFNTGTGSFSTMPSSADPEREKLLGLQWSSCFNAGYNSDIQHFNNQRNRNIFLDSILRFYKQHHHSMRDLKSVDVLRTVFN